jgi:hypothetical protein
MGRTAVYYASIAVGFTILGVGAAVPLTVRTARLSAGAFSLISSAMTTPWSDDRTESILSPAEVVAMRFPDQPDEAEVAAPDDPVKLGEAIQAEAAGTFEDQILFTPYPTYVRTISEPEPANRMATQPEITPTATSTPAINKPTVVATVHHTGRTDAVFNEAQIAMIKRRLDLRPEQEYMWPAVEAALRKLSYAKGSRKPGVDINRVAAIDPGSAGVQDLNNAATPLVMSFSGDQRRELLSIAHIAGLESLVPKF